MIDYSPLRLQPHNLGQLRAMSRRNQSQCVERQECSAQTILFWTLISNNKEL